MDVQEFIDTLGVDLLHLVEGVTFFLTLFLILSVLPLTLSMITDKRTDGMPFNTFLFSFTNSYMACLYGSIVDNRIILTLNSIGVVLYGLASLVFILVCSRRSSSLMKTVLALSILLIIHYYAGTLPLDQRKEFIGPLSLTTAIIMLTSPLLDVGHFIKQKSCEGMATTMIVLGFLCTSSWTFYGHLLKDPYIFLPNLPGFVSSAVYFSLMAFYGFPKKEKQS